MTWVLAQDRTGDIAVPCGYEGMCCTTQSIGTGCLRALGLDVFGLKLQHASKHRPRLVTDGLEMRTRTLG